MSEIFGVQHSLTTTICADADDAIANGFNYSLPEYKACEVKQVVVVKHGTTSGASTVDLIIADETGQKYVVMLTGNLLKSIPC